MIAIRRFTPPLALFLAGALVLLVASRVTILPSVWSRDNAFFCFIFRAPENQYVIGLNWRPPLWLSGWKIRLRQTSADDYLVDRLEQSGMVVGVEEK